MTPQAAGTTDRGPRAERQTEPAAATADDTAPAPAAPGDDDQHPEECSATPVLGGRSGRGGRVEDASSVGASGGGDGRTEDTSSAITTGSGGGWAGGVSPATAPGDGRRADRAAPAPGSGDGTGRGGVSAVDDACRPRSGGIVRPAGPAAGGAVPTPVPEGGKDDKAAGGPSGEGAPRPPVPGTDDRRAEAAALASSDGEGSAVSGVCGAWPEGVSRATASGVGEQRDGAAAPASGDGAGEDRGGVAAVAGVGAPWPEGVTRAVRHGTGVAGASGDGRAPDGGAGRAEGSGAESASGGTGTDAELLIAASVLLADAALSARQAGAELAGALGSWRFGVQAMRRPLWALGAAAACARSLTSPAGLGFGANGGIPGELARIAGSLTYRRPAAVAMAVDAFALRIRAAAATHPSLAAPQARRLTDALVAGDRTAALRAVHALVERLGVTRALTTVSPVIMELLALTGLLDENPVNDEFSWVTLAGGVPTTDPLFGLPSSVLKYLNPGPGRAERTDPDPILAKVLGTSRNDIVSYVNDIAALGNHGLVLLRRVECTDGAVRHVLLLPGTSFGLLSNSTPQDLVGAFDGLLRTDTTYTRAAKKLLRRAGVPAGSELMLVGHSLGGLTAMNLAADLDVASEYRVTHVIALGSPIDGKRPADHHTRVVSLVNKHDVIPMLDGRGPVSPHDVPDTWTELAWLDESYDYPLSHAPQAYSDSLRGEMAHHRRRVNELIGVYDGRITGNQPYMLRDK